MTRRLTAAVAVLVAADAVAMWSMAHFVRWGWHLLGLVAIFVAVLWWMRRESTSLSVRAIVVISAAIMITGLTVFPLTSDDVYRYVWDGRVQLAGIDPYRYPPLDPALAWLRDPGLFPPGSRPMINRPTVPTIYPPIAQAWFALVAAVTPWPLGPLGIRIGAGAAVVLTTGLLARFLGPRRRLALIYGANPLTMIEASNGGHLDVLVALAIFGVAWAAVHRRFWLAGLFLGVAGGLKLVPLLLVPVFLRGRRWRTTLVAVPVALVGYVPHALAVGALVFGFLPGYWREEGYDSGGRFALLAWLPPDVRLPIAAALGLALAGMALVRSAREPVIQTCCWLYGAAFCIATPIYPWYALPLVVIVLMAGRLEWLAVWVAMYVAFVFDHSVAVQAAGYGAALLVVLTAAWGRGRHRRRSPDREPGATEPDRSVAERPGVSTP